MGQVSPKPESEPAWRLNGDTQTRTRRVHRYPKPGPDPFFKAKNLSKYHFAIEILTVEPNETPFKVNV